MERPNSRRAASSSPARNPGDVPLCSCASPRASSARCRPTVRRSGFAPPNPQQPRHAALEEELRPTTSPVNKTLRPRPVVAEPIGEQQQQRRWSVVGETRSAGQGPASAAPRCAREHALVPDPRVGARIPELRRTHTCSGHRGDDRRQGRRGPPRRRLQVRDAARALSGKPPAACASRRRGRRRATRGAARRVASNNSATAASPCGDMPTTPARAGPAPAARSGNVGGIRHSAHARTQPSSARRRIASSTLECPLRCAAPARTVRTRLADEQGALRKQAATACALLSSPYHVG